MTDDPSLIEDLIAHYLERRQGGDECLEELCRTNPSAADALREGVADLEAMGFLARPPSEEAAPPTAIGRYPVHGELGRGGLGIVHLARDPRLARFVAIKRLPSRLADDPIARARFEREARILASFEHPHIAGIHSLEDDADGPFLVLALVRGETLSDRQKGRPMPIEECLPILRQIALALEAAHEAAVIHRDLKPQNVMIDERGGSVKVLDFGLAKALAVEDSIERPTSADPPETPFESAAGALVGTPGYMSPEQIRGEEVDARTDIFAWGCLAFECLTGELAFDGREVDDRLDRTLACEVDLSSLPEDLDPSVRSMIACALSPAPEDRPGTITIIRRALDDALARRSHFERAEPRRRIGNLPEPWTRFIGREALLGESAVALDRARLVTLAGPGGAGKTRLAIEVARRSESLHASDDHGGPWWVDLSPLSDPDLVVPAVAASLGVRPEPGIDPFEGLRSAIGRGPGLLVIDNCEHLREAASTVVVGLIGTCPELRILVTSRESLGVVGEEVLRVPPLSLPSPAEIALGIDALRLVDEAVRLFEERARAVHPAFELTDGDAGLVTEICRRLDGLPLAIELAAARLSTLSLAELAARLGESLRWLSGRDATRQPRQRTLRSLIDWSHDQLEEPARMLYRRLSVFAGGATLGAIERVAADEALPAWEVFDQIAHLVEKSLVELDRDDSSAGAPARYRMLETLREHAGDRLVESAEVDEITRRHIAAFAEFAESLEPSLEGGGQAEGFARLETDRANLRAAIERAAARGEAEEGARILGAAWRFYSVRGHWAEGRRLAEHLLSGAGKLTAPAMRARILRSAGLLAMQQGDYDPAEGHLAEGLELERAGGDEGRLVAAIGSLAQLELRRGRYTEARGHFEENLALSRTLGNESGVAMTLAMLGNTAQLAGDHVAARPYFEESLILSEKLENRYLTAGSLHNLADLVLKDGETDRAQQLWDRALELNRELGNRPWEARNRMSLGLAAKLAGDYPEARRQYAEAVAIHRELGDKEGMRDGVLFFGMLAGALGQHHRAIRLLAAANAFGRTLGLSVFSGLRDRVDGVIRELEGASPGKAFAESWKRGAELSIEQALDDALDE